MEVIYGLNKINKFKRPVVALGVFDGVHRGHRYILKKAVKKAQGINGVSVAVSFHPHPQGKESLYSLEHRLKLISELGINVCIVIRFNRAFSAVSADDFIRDILVDRIGALYIYIGKNFRFGKYAQGDYKLLDRFSKIYGYSVKAFNVIKVNHRVISSTYIRKLITQGNLNAAGKLLQKPVTILGTVIKGIALGRRLGFPTANINPHHEILPPAGVYLVKAVLNNESLDGICNIGNKPTVLKIYRNKQKYIEVYIFDFNKNIYGKNLEIKFIHKIRDEKKFPSLKLLSAQIQKDIISAKKLLSSL